MSRTYLSRTIGKFYKQFYQNLPYWRGRDFPTKRAFEIRFLMRKHLRCNDGAVLCNNDLTSSESSSAEHRTRCDWWKWIDYSCWDICRSLFGILSANQIVGHSFVVSLKFNGEQSLPTMKCVWEQKQGLNEDNNWKHLPWIFIAWEKTLWKCFHIQK